MAVLIGNNKIIAVIVRNVDEKLTVLRDFLKTIKDIQKSNFVNKCNGFNFWTQ